jgi:DNA-binding NarL/FixJ family response regulator
MEDGARKQFLIRYWAVGFLLKDMLRVELVATIRLIRAGGRRIPPEVAQQLAEHAVDDALTFRELDVLKGSHEGAPIKSSRQSYASVSIR